MPSTSLNHGSATARPRVIVIDDDPLFRNLITSVLRKDFFVSVASEGSEGYYKAIEHTPDLAVIDVQMPGWDGLKTLKAFRAHQQLSQVLIVMLTADTSRETVMAAIQGGAHDYVIKTKFSREEFLGKLNRLLSYRVSGSTGDPQLDGSSTAPIPCPHGSRTASALANAGGGASSEPDLQTALDSWE